MKRKNIKSTYGLIGLLIVVFLVDFFVLNQEGTKVLSVNHLLKGNQWGYLSKYGRLLNVSAMNPEWWRLFTSMFLHAGIPHLIVNCLGLYCIGSVIEQRLGGMKLLVIYIFSGIGSAMITMLVTYGSVGASGAIYGIGGTLLILIIRDKKNVWSTRPVMQKIIIIAYLTIPNLSGVNTLISHEVGLIIGILLGLLLVTSTKEDSSIEQNREKHMNILVEEESL